MRTYVATSSEDKLRELRELFEDSIVELGAVTGYKPPVEDGETYADNALIKARALHSALKAKGIEAAVLADDSGIEVEALDGRPGVHSARYAGEDASWEQRLGKLLAEMDGIENRRCRYVCFFAFIYPEGRELIAAGHVDGTLTTEVTHGENGFGYDPVFQFDPAGKTFAQLSDTYKHLVSHRGNAARNLLTILNIHARHRAGD